MFRPLKGSGGMGSLDFRKLGMLNTASCERNTEGRLLARAGFTM